MAPGLPEVPFNHRLGLIPVGQDLETPSRAGKCPSPKAQLCSLAIYLGTPLKWGKDQQQLQALRADGDFFPSPFQIPAHFVTSGMV